MKKAQRRMLEGCWTSSLVQRVLGRRGLVVKSWKLTLARMREVCRITRMLRNPTRFVGMISHRRRHKRQLRWRNSWVKMRDRKKLMERWAILALRLEASMSSSRFLISRLLFSVMRPLSLTLCLSSRVSC